MIKRQQVVLPVSGPPKTIMTVPGPLSNLGNSPSQNCDTIIYLFLPAAWPESTPLIVPEPAVKIKLNGDFQWCCRRGTKGEGRRAKGEGRRVKREKRRATRERHLHSNSLCRFVSLLPLLSPFAL